VRFSGNRPPERFFLHWKVLVLLGGEAYHVHAIDAAADFLFSNGVPDVDNGIFFDYTVEILFSFCEWPRSAGRR